MSLTPDEVERYRRHLLLPEVGGQGQQRLKSAKVALVGLGGLGCPMASYLAAAGVGHLKLIDGDRVELSNLQRQPLFSPNDVGSPKVQVAGRVLRQQNPAVEIDAIAHHLGANNASDLTAGCDLVIEGVDRFAPRYVLNAACHDAKIPLLSAAIGRFDGQIALFPMTATSACYRCLVPSIPEDAADCETQGVLGAVPGLLAASRRWRR